MTGVQTCALPIDLIVNANATAKNTKVEFMHGAHTRSVPASLWMEYIKQKQRHFSTAPHYKFRDKFLLILEPASRLLFYTSLIVLLSYTFLWPFVLGIFGLRLALQLTVLIGVSRKLNEPGLVLVSLFFDIFSPLIFTPIYLTKATRQGRNRWK